MGKINNSIFSIVTILLFINLSVIKTSIPSNYPTSGLERFISFDTGAPKEEITSSAAVQLEGGELFTNRFLEPAKAWFKNSVDIIKFGPFAPPSFTHSISFWFRTLGDDNGPIVSMNNQSEYTGFKVGFNKQRICSYNAYVSPNTGNFGHSFNCNDDTEFADDKWHLGVVTYNIDETIKYYVDGVLTDTDVSTVAYYRTTGPEDLYVGYSISAIDRTYGYYGVMDEVAIYSRVITADEVKQIFDNFSLTTRSSDSRPRYVAPSSSTNSSSTSTGSTSSTSTNNTTSSSTATTTNTDNNNSGSTTTNTDNNNSGSTTTNTDNNTSTTTTNTSTTTNTNTDNNTTTNTNTDNNTTTDNNTSNTTTETNTSNTTDNNNSNTTTETNTSNTTGNNSSTTTSDSTATTPTTTTNNNTTSSASPTTENNNNTSSTTTTANNTTNEPSEDKLPEKVEIKEDDSTKQVASSLADSESGSTSNTTTAVTQYDLYIPTIISARGAVRTNSEHYFVKTHFSNYFDTYNANLTQIKITRLPTNGTFRYNGSAITLDQEISTLASFENSLLYIPNENFSGLDTFEWKGRSRLGKNYSNASGYTMNVISDPMCTGTQYRASETNPNCISTCGVNTFKSFSTVYGNICESCSQNCDSCQSFNNCLKCQANYFTYNGHCTQLCPDGTSPVNGNCQTAPSCIAGSYFDFEKNSCQNCVIPKCLDCSSEIACKQCDPTFDLTKFDSSNSQSFGIEASKLGGGVSGSQSSSLSFEGAGCVESSALLNLGAKYLGVSIVMLLMTSIFIMF